MLLDRSRPLRNLVAVALLSTSSLAVGSGTAAAGRQGPSPSIEFEFEVVVVDTSGPTPSVHTDRVDIADYLELLRDADADTTVAPQATYVPLGTAAPAAPTTVDPVRDRQWQLDQIGVEPVWAAGIDGTGITIGVVDTGVVSDDMDLLAAADFTGGAPGAFEHGTTVAGIAAATRDNGQGGSGVAPGASIVSAKVCSGGSCASDDIARGIVWVVDQGADVVNISLGGPASAVVARTIDWAIDQGVTVVAAAGNSSCSTAYTVGCDPTVDNVAYPAGFANVVAVTATNVFGASPYWTSKGHRSTVAAPGESLWYSTNGLYGASGSGTSYASPVVAGIVALMREAEPTLTPVELRAALMLSADPSTVALIQPTVSRDWYYGAGDVDAAAAVAMAHQLADATRLAPTIVSGNQSLTVSWTAAPGATSYTIDLAPGDGAVTATTSGTSVTFAGLENGRTYAVSVTATTGSGTDWYEPAIGVPTASLAAPALDTAGGSTSGQGRIYAWFTAPPSNVNASATLNGVQLGSSSIAEYPTGSGSFYASWPTTAVVTDAAFEVWFENGLGATSARASATVTVTRLLRAPGNVSSSTTAGLTTIGWDPSIVLGGPSHGMAATTYVVDVYGYRKSTGTTDNHVGLSTATPSIALTLYPGVTYSAYITAYHSGTAMWSDTTSTTVLALPPPLPALGNPTVTASGSNVIVAFDTQAAADAIVLTSSRRSPFVVGTAQSAGAGRSQVTVSLATLGLSTGDAGRVCVAATDYFDGSSFSQHGAWSTGVSFFAGSDATSDNDLCTTNHPPGTTPLSTTTTSTTTTAPSPTTSTTSTTPTSPTPTAAATSSTTTTTTVPGARFDPITPERLADTRTGSGDGSDDGGLSANDLDGTGIGGRVQAGQTLRVPIAGRGSIDPAATAVSANITAVDAAAAGFLTVWPCGTERPLAASVNYTRGSVDANAVLVGLGSGDLCVFSMATVDVIVDVTGVFIGSTRAFEPLAPARIIDTRDTGRRLPSGGSISIVVAGVAGVPADAAAVTLNVTAVDPGSAGFVTVWPCGSPRPTTSNLNVTAGDTRPNLVTVKVGTGGQVCAFSLGSVDLVVDVNGWWGSAGRYAYSPVSPFRLADTRETPGLARLAAGQTLRVRATGVGGVPADARAVAANITVVAPSAAGFVTVWPCDRRPLASTGNYRAGTVRPNAAAVAVSPEGDLCLFSQAATDVVIDITGYWS